MQLGDLAGSVGKGFFAGLMGTAAMTVSSTIEMKLRRRAPSSTPVDAANKVLGIKPVDEQAKKRFANVVHWGYGIAWGSVRGLLGAAGIKGPQAMLAHFGLVWGTELVVLPALEVTPPVSEWGVTEIAIDAWHHLIYAATTGLAYDFLDR